MLQYEPSSSRNRVRLTCTCANYLPPPPPPPPTPHTCLVIFVITGLFMQRAVANFLARNRKAAKNTKRRATAITSAVIEGNRGPVHAARFSSPQKMLTPSTTANALQNCHGNTEVEDGTVTVSKEYLNSLLRSSAMSKNGAAGRGTNLLEAKFEAQSLHSHPNKVHPNSINPRQDNSCDVFTYQQGNTGTQKRLPESMISQGSNVAPTCMETGGRGRRGSTISPAAEEYFPFGRPGCGAPLRTASGHVMADLRGGGYNPRYPSHPSLLPPKLLPLEIALWDSQGRTTTKLMY